MAQLSYNRQGCYVQTGQGRKGRMLYKGKR